MDRPIHWTQDIRFSHLRRPPAWWHFYPGTLYTPRPAARMEKRIAEERQSEWRWYTSQGPDRDRNRRSLNAFFFPWDAYGRTWARLRAALAGGNAADVEPGMINPDCVECALCLPFYGCLVAKLQGTIRSFYQIEGDELSDWKDGWCCPCVALEKCEYEILAREAQHSRIKTAYVFSPPTTDEYLMEVPMTSDSIDSPSPPVQINKKRRSDAILQRLPDCLFKSSQSRQTTSATSTPSHVLVDHGVVVAHIVQPDHNLENDVTLVPEVKKKTSDHGLETDLVVASSETRASPHGLGVDVKTMAQNFTRKHDLTTDGASAKAISQAEPHPLSSDKLTSFVSNTSAPASSSEQIHLAKDVLLSNDARHSGINVNSIRRSNKGSGS
ncbi:hypothetical protein VHEMI03347 [[Torrubiella] hemipterigena]|uniref:Uncharacterized protein n=1 Tax=[Torrubiella] hemipterigena TaxID=1531966 RepID=A0A0A1TAK3_9HYPO|nr:hypothetical protein VHEMI03347 [[Torrubiella] hemipterigena]